MRIRSATVMLLLAFVGNPRLSGQQTMATLVGNITDPSSAVVTGAAVVVTNLETNVKRETKTDSSGNYTIPFLVAGNYGMTVSLAGFRQSQFDKLTLQVGQTARLNVTLEIGDLNQSVAVPAYAVALQTENAAVGTVIDSAKILELPLNGRNFIQLAQLIPGAQPGTPGSITVRRGRGSIGQSDSPFGSTGFSANGVRDTANRYFIDGVESMDGDAFSGSRS